MTGQTFSMRLLATAAVAAVCMPSGGAITTPTIDISPKKTAIEADAKQFQASLVWQEVAPGRDVYMSISMALGDGLLDKLGAHARCNSGYMGAQFRSGGYNTLLWSMSGREEGQVVPVGEHCHYDCFDCSPPNTRDFQCKRDDYELKAGVLYTFTVQMEMQNASGAMWSATMEDPTAEDKGHPVEIGRVFFKDAEFGLPTENCRRLGLDSYAFQEYFNPGDRYFTTKAAWSAVSLSGAMQPEDAKGYCDESTMMDLEGLSLIECKTRCATEDACHFASYSAVDHSYAKVDGSHCMLYGACRAKSTYFADIWWTYAKHDLPSIALTGFKPLCRHYQDETGKRTLTETAEVVSSPTGAVEFEFQTGPDVQCPEAFAEAMAASAENRAEPVVAMPSSVLRGFRGTAATVPQIAAPVEEEMPLFP